MAPDQSLKSKKRFTTGSWTVLGIILLGLSLLTVGLVSESKFFEMANPPAAAVPAPAP